MSGYIILHISARQGANGEMEEDQRQWYSKPAPSSTNSTKPRMTKLWRTLMWPRRLMFLKSSNVSSNLFSGQFWFVQVAILKEKQSNNLYRAANHHQTVCSTDMCSTVAALRPDVGVIVAVVTADMWYVLAMFWLCIGYVMSWVRNQSLTDPPGTSQAQYQQQPQRQAGVWKPDLDRTGHKENSKDTWGKCSYHHGANQRRFINLDDLKSLRSSRTKASWSNSHISTFLSFSTPVAPTVYV